MENKRQEEVDFKKKISRNQIAKKLTPVKKNDRRELNFFTALYGILFEPVKTIKLIVKQEPVGLALLVIILSSLVMLYPPMLELVSLFTSFTPVLLASILALFFSITGLLFGSFLLVLFARLLGGEGDFFSLFSAAGISQFVYIFTPVFIFAANSLQLSGFANQFLSNLIYYWYLVLLIISLKESQNFSLPRAILTLAATVGGVILILALVGVSILGIFFV